MLLSSFVLLVFLWWKRTIFSMRKGLQYLLWTMKLKTIYMYICKKMPAFIYQKSNTNVNWHQQTWITTTLDKYCQKRDVFAWFFTILWNKVWVKKPAHVQKLAIDKKSTTFVQSSRNLVKMIASSSFIWIGRKLWISYWWPNFECVPFFLTQSLAQV